MTKSQVSVSVAVVLLAAAAAACGGVVYEVPSGPYNRLTTFLTRTTILGVSASETSANFTARWGVPISQPQIGTTSRYENVQSDSRGNYYMIDMRLPAIWGFIWNSPPCAGKQDAEEILQHYQAYQFLCELTVYTAFAYSQTSDGQVVYTGGGDKLVDGWNGTMYQNQCRTSADGRYDICYQNDGNFVMYDGSQPIWASNTDGTTPGRVVMQSDGNLVVYDGSDVPRWASNTSGQPGNFVVVQSNRCTLMYDELGQAIPWGTSTCVNPGSSTTQQPPIAPTDPNSSVSGSTVYLWWTPPPGPIGDYVLEAGTSPGQANIGTYYLNNQPYTTFYGVPPGVYWLQLKARNNGGTSPPSSPFAVVVY